MRRLLLGVGLVFTAVLGWRALSQRAGRPLTELDDAYSSPHPPDPYIDTLFGRVYLS